MEENTENVAAEIQAEGSVQTHETAVSESNETPKTEESSHLAKDKEYNFAQLRKSKEHLERENKELKKYLEQVAQNSKQQPSKDASDGFDIEDDDLAEGKHLKKMYQEITNLKKQLYDEKIASVPDRLKTKFTDFDDVVSVENVEKLKNSEPELYATITSGSDLYAKGVSAYKALKALGIAKENFETQKTQVKDNHARPMSTQAIKGQGALSDSNIFARGLTPELKKQLQQEMSEAVKAR